MLKWTQTGMLTGNAVYTFTWGIVGKPKFWMMPDVYALSTHLYRKVKEMVTEQASVPEGYPRYSEHQDVTIFQVRAPVYVPERIIHVEEVLQAGNRIMDTYTIYNFNVMRQAKHFMPPSGPLAGTILPLPGAFVANMNSEDAINDPTGVPAPKSDLWDRLGISDVLAPAKTVLKVGIAGVSAYALYRVYRGIGAIPLPQKKGG